MKKAPKITADEVYLKAVVDYEHARNAYDHKKGNKAIDRAMRSAKQIRIMHPDGGEKLFTSLLTCNMLHVVGVAAFCLISLNPKLARAAFERLAKGPPGEARFAAEMTLEEWKIGRLDPDWFMKK